MIHTYGVLESFASRPGVSAFHLASEEFLRVQLLRLASGEVFGPSRVEGDVLVGCFKGRVEVGAERVVLDEGHQAVLPRGEVVLVRGEFVESFVQIVWAPAFPKVSPA
jgi:hypothetical protein